MASFKIFTILAIVAVFVPSALAKEFVVGDDRGWTLNFDYQAWAQGKEFNVGDKLVFKYAEGAHNVLRVNGTDFQQCAALAGTEALISGNDVITLATPGRKWYICGIGKHCEAGKMKLVITVQPHLGSPASSPSPSPAPTSAARGSAASGFSGWMVVMFGILIGLIIV